MARSAQVHENFLGKFSENSEIVEAIQPITPEIPVEIKKEQKFWV